MPVRVLVPLSALLSCGLVVLSAGVASAQSLGTFRWQLQPYCNVLSLNVSQNGGNFTVDGTDDLCGGTPSPAAAVGMAFPKPDGTIGLGINVVLAPSGIPVHISASISLATVSGSWQDSSGNSGSFVFNPAIAPGSPRPAPKPAFAAGLSAVNARITEVGTPTTPGDAANKAYVDTTVTNGPKEGWLTVFGNATFWSKSANLAAATVQRPAGLPVGVYCIGLPPNSGFSTTGAVAVPQQTVAGTGVSSQIALMTFIQGPCQDAGFPIGVYTYTASGASADRSFTVLIPR